MSFDALPSMLFPWALTPGQDATSAVDGAATTETDGDDDEVRRGVVDRQTGTTVVLVELGGKSHSSWDVTRNGHRMP